MSRESPEIEGFVRHLRQPRTELADLAQQLRLAGWEDRDIERLRFAPRLWERRDDRCPTCLSRWRVSMRQRGAPCPDPWHYGVEEKR